MGNTLTFIRLHGRRLKNRYNAQYRALELIEKEKMPSAPRHPVDPVVGTQEDHITVEELQRRDPKLDEYLKDVHVQSFDKVHHDSFISKSNPARPLPESREHRSLALFVEPEIEKGWCTITQVCELLASYEEDPAQNNIQAIAKKYGLEEKKVENLLKYYSVFHIVDLNRDTLPSEDKEEKRTFDEGIKELREGHEKTKNFRESLAKKLEAENQGSPGQHTELKVEKAIKN